MVKLQNQNAPKDIQTNLAPNNCLVREFVRKKAYRFVAIKNCQVVVSEESGVTDENLRGAKVKKVILMQTIKDIISGFHGNLHFCK